MRTGVTISAIGHAAAMLWATVSLSMVPLPIDSPNPIVVDVTSTSDFSQLTAGVTTAPQQETPAPLVEQIGESKPVEDPNAKVVTTREITASTEAPPPVPPPRPPAPEAKVTAEPTRDLIAEALKKEEAKKPEPKIASRVPVPPRRPPQKQQPKFDPKKVEALLDKRVPQRLAATGQTLNNTVALGAPSGIAARLSQSELDALRARLAQLWNPPSGARNPQELVVQVRMKLKPDGTLAAPPTVLTHGQSPFFMAARDSAIRAVFRGQPFDMLRPEHYEQWKDIEITFDPRDMVRG
ncbi:MAG: cell envelope integrity protein TolA [Xanthobacteraceae bacterium]